MKHLFEYESWSDYKTPHELRSRVESVKKERAKDFFKKRVTGEEASDMFTDDEEFKQDMREMFFANGCNTQQQLDFLLSLNLPKTDLETIIAKNKETLEDLRGVLGKDYAVRQLRRSKDEIEEYIDNITSVNMTLRELV
jgi:hypothetical protein